MGRIDLLKKKLKEGVKISDHVPSYGDRPNDVEAAVKCASVSSLLFSPTLSDEY
jgi:hypothetical protein